MPPILPNNLVLLNLMFGPSFLVLFVQEDSLEDVLLKRPLSLLELILEVATIETHFQKLWILWYILDEIHRIEIRFSASYSIRIVASGDIADSMLFVKVASVPFLHIFDVLTERRRVRRKIWRADHARPTL